MRIILECGGLLPSGLKLVNGIVIRGLITLIDADLGWGNTVNPVACEQREAETIIVVAGQIHRAYLHLNDTLYLSMGLRQYNIHKSEGTSLRQQSTIDTAWIDGRVIIFRTHL